MQLDFNKPIHVYFCGIGGISMSGLAEILADRGFRVSGSDMKASELTDSLEAKGIKIYIGQRATNITDDIDLFVYTAAISKDNPEWTEMVAKNIPNMSRADLLGQIMTNYELPIAISGTHGKTTTTSMVSEVLLGADLDPTLSVGGILKSIGGNIRIGRSDYFVTEACEYTNSFLSFFPKISLILNIEEDHMDFFKDINDIRNSFRRFAEILPADGALVINGEIDSYTEITDGLECKIYTFGLDNSFDYYATDIRFAENGCATYLLHSPNGECEVSLGVPGKHNVYNSLACFCCADLCKVDRATTLAALSRFTGTNRRFEYKGKIGEVTIVDDYAHHPTEIESTLRTALTIPHGKLWVAFQPHTYTRTKAFLTQFADALSLADTAIVSEIMGSREVNNWNVKATQITDLMANGIYIPTFEEICDYILTNAKPGDLIITMGGGNVYRCARMIAEKL